MSDTVVLAIIASLAPTLMALAAFVISLKNSRKSDTLLTETAKIHVLANDNLSKITSALAVSNEKILGLEKLISSNVESKKEAQIQADKDAQKTLSDAVVAASKQIEAQSNQAN